ncbi:MAG: hypothetical protein ABS951_05025 [Solibacillus sp.]
MYKSKPSFGTSCYVYIRVDTVTTTKMTSESIIVPFTFDGFFSQQF